MLFQNESLTANVGGSDVSTAAVVTRRRAKLNNPENNIHYYLNYLIKP